jgi:hypothetical protein
LGSGLRNFVIADMIITHFSFSLVLLFGWNTAGRMSFVGGYT